MRYVIIIILLTLIGSVNGQNKGYKATRNESHQFRANNIQKIDINVQNAHITINECAGEFIQINIKVEVKDNIKSNVDREIDWLKCFVEKHKSEVIISNSVVLPKGLKQSPQCKHITYIEIFLPNIEMLKVKLNVGSLELENIHSNINFQAKLCKVKFKNCALDGELNQTLGETNISNSIINGNYYFANVIAKLEKVEGTFDLDATDSKINVIPKNNNYVFRWKLLRSETNWVTTASIIPNITFEMNKSSLNLPEFMNKQNIKSQYSTQNKAVNSVFQLSAESSFINIYNN
ncbi:MAG TPA: hypothetical protein PJ990_04540 [Saprospiraceae bacterium]|nr:hypothetical protein [Saprospiraceae bacterium]